MHSHRNDAVKGGGGAHRSLGAGGRAHHAGPHTGAPGWVRRKVDTCGRSLPRGFHREGQVRQVSRLRTGWRE